MSSENSVAREIRKLLKDKDGLLLSHNYQRDAIQELADFTGDSLGLSQIAAESDKKLIVFCGVHFMAESASILAPDKTILLPRLEAGCPMADMITAESLRKKKTEYPDVPVVCYVNSSADVKAESDICCTSANAVRVVNSLETEKILMVPDMNLSKYAAARTGKNIIPWKGFCPTHHNLKSFMVISAKEKHPDAEFIAHPECMPEVLELADNICSTSAMYSYVRGAHVKEFIIGTEMGILYRLRRDNPEKKFYLASDDLICPNMKITSLEDVLAALQQMKHVIHVEDEIRKPARRALNRMLSVPRD